MWPSKTWFFCRRWTTEFCIVIERPFCADIFASREHIQNKYFKDTSIGEGEQNVTLIQISTDSRLCEFWGETRHRAICYISIIFNGTIDSTSFKGKAHHSSEVKQVASFSKPWRRSPQVLSLPGCPIQAYFPSVKPPYTLPTLIAKITFPCPTTTVLDLSRGRTAPIMEGKVESKLQPLYKMEFFDPLSICRVEYTVGEGQGKILFNLSVV